MFAEAIEDILRDQCTPAAVRAIEKGDSPYALWRGIAEAGFLDLMATEDDGGAALPLPELFPVLAHFGRYAMPLPFAQSIAARMLVAEGEVLPNTPVTIAPTLLREGGRLRCPAVPYGTVADAVLAADGDQLWLLPVSAAECTQRDSRGQVATLTWGSENDATPLDGDARALQAVGAATYAALMAGALQQVFHMSLQYCNDRQQFGRSLGKFQALQHALSVMAEHVAAASIAAEAAFQGEKVPGQAAAALAKARTSEAAVLVANSAHALHGAIGVTEEFDLQLFTRRLHGWRRAHGSESHWHEVLGGMVLATGGSLSEFVRAA